ncbi:MAG: T9SS type A sorting domain-containing protein [Flavobacteriaceae bacterium]
MKKLFFLTFSILCSSLGFAQIVNIPDQVFKALLLSADESNSIAKDENQNSIRIDANQDGEIQISEALIIDGLSISNDNLTSLTGIEAFDNLNVLALSSSSLVSLGEVQQMMNLTSLQVYCSLITSISFHEMHSLKYLIIGSNTPITDIDLCGTSVFSLYCSNNPTLQSINFKNNVVSGMNLGEASKGFPPPLPNIWLENNIALQNICYDTGEYQAIVAMMEPNLLANINFTTDCDSSCLLANEQKNQNSLTVWPNPVGNSLYIESAPNVSLQSVIIYNAMGQLVNSYSAQDNLLTIDVTNLASGCYSLEINSNQEKVTKKFVKI